MSLNYTCITNFALFSIFHISCLVFPAPPKPTNMSFVRRHSVKPLANLLQYALTDSNPRLTTSWGGVRREGQLNSCMPEK